MAKIEASGMFSGVPVVGLREETREATESRAEHFYGRGSDGAVSYGRLSAEEILRQIGQ